VSIFTTTADSALPVLVDKFSSIFGKININVAAGRSPDNLAFSGRRSSAMGTMSIRDSLNAFTTETVIATKSVGQNDKIFDEVLEASSFAQ
jgi:glyceraldehyde-3-phosphate dehydrogenase (NADP+)